MSSTKEKILSSALKLFNRDGMVNVRLQHIADDAIVSVGNLAYHFANKEAILTGLYQRLTEKQRFLLAEYRVVPLFDNIDRLIQNTFRLQKEYVFFYLDTLEILRAYPEIGNAHKQHIVSQVGQLKMMLDFNVARGALIEEPFDGVFNQLSEQIWMTMDLWLTKESVMTDSEPGIEEYRLAVWNLFIPFFTDMGKREYKQMLQMPTDLY